MKRILEVLSNNNINSNETKSIDFVELLDVSYPHQVTTITYDNIVYNVKQSTILAKLFASIVPEIVAGSTLEDVLSYLASDVTNRKKLKRATLAQVDTREKLEDVKTTANSMNSDDYKAMHHKNIGMLLKTLQNVVQKSDYTVYVTDDVDIVFNDSLCAVTYSDLVNKEIVEESVCDLLAHIRYEAIKKVGENAYRLILSEELSFRAIKNTILEISLLDSVHVISSNDNIINIVLEVVR